MPYITQLKPNVLQSFEKELPDQPIIGYGNPFADKPSIYWYTVRKATSLVAFSDSASYMRYINQSFARKFFIPPIWVSNEDYHQYYFKLSVP